MLAEKTDSLEHIIVHTGQHYDTNLSDIFFQDLGIPMPNYHLGVGSLRHASQMGQIMIQLDQILEKEQPDMVLVFGDTNSTAAAAITAAKNNIPIAHIEAGLREWNKQIPEEINKLLTDAVTDLYFCPTETGVKNLASQGIIKGVFNVGDIGIDLIFNNEKRINAVINKLNIEIQKPYFFVTCHRAANTDNVENLKEILSTFQEIQENIIFPLHPRTRKVIERENLSHFLEQPNIKVIEPIGFWETQFLIKNAKMCLTDSGGVIKEAYFHRVPAIIIDAQTEWIETVQEGWNIVTGANKTKILDAIKHWQRPTIHTQALGNGTAARKIIEIIQKYFYSIPLTSVNGKGL